MKSDTFIDVVAGSDDYRMLKMWLDSRSFTRFDFGAEVHSNVTFSTEKWQSDPIEHLFDAPVCANNNKLRVDIEICHYKMLSRDDVSVKYAIVAETDYEQWVDINFYGVPIHEAATKSDFYLHKLVDAWVAINIDNPEKE